ncbi:MAG TPA: hypothetical protein VM674_01850 [Candidatus Acidoferrum sp.]|nr:hypothetical protein [Candidatus Acidoferrum sp.]
MARGRLTRQRGQALLIVLAFVAAFLFLIAAGLWLASGAFLDLASVKTDTRSTYALDGGLAYAIEINDSAAKGAGCNPTPSTSFPLAYGSTTISVTVTITPVPGCKVKKPSYTVNVTATGTRRQLKAQISSSNAGKKATWVVNWEAFQ